MFTTTLISEDDMFNGTEDENGNCNAEVRDNDEPIADIYDDVINRENFLELFGNSEILVIRAYTGLYSVDQESGMNDSKINAI